MKQYVYIGFVKSAFLLLCLQRTLTAGAIFFKSASGIFPVPALPAGLKAGTAFFTFAVQVTQPKFERAHELYDIHGGVIIKEELVFALQCFIDKLHNTTPGIYILFICFTGGAK